MTRSPLRFLNVPNKEPRPAVKARVENLRAQQTKQSLSPTDKQVATQSLLTTDKQVAFADDAAEPAPKRDSLTAMGFPRLS